jgi:diguanylate cyclase (GGDEF)-like protein
VRAAEVGARPADTPLKCLRRGHEPLIGVVHICGGIHVQEARDTAGVTTRLILTYVRRRLGDDGVDRLLTIAGETRPRELLEDERSWSSYDQKVALFEAAQELTGDPLVARRIGESLLQERVAAPLRMVVAALGSPQQVLRSVAKANVKFSTNSQMRSLESRPGHAVVTYRVLDGYTPNLHDCLYTQGIITQATVLFGLPPASVEESTCQVEGAEECRFVVTWSRLRSPLGRGRRHREQVRDAEIEALREQVTDLQHTVADLVSSDDLDDVLRRIASRASAAVRGQRFLLAVRLDEEDTDRIHSDGFGVAEAEHLGAALLALRPGVVPAPDVLVADVASAARSYGRLAAYLPTGTGFLPAEQVQLDAYARLAAAALDASTALALARDHAAVSEALLTSAHLLTEAEDESSIAQLVAASVPSVLGASSASVRLWDPAERALVTAGVHGFSTELAERSWELTIPLDRTPEVRAMLEDARPRLYTPEDDDPFVRDQLAGFGHAAVAVVPILTRGEFLGVVFANFSPEDPPPRRETLFRGMTGLADQAGLALANVRLLDRTRHQATHDALTGLANRVLFHELLDAALAGGRRSGARTAVCYLDLDGFKRVNDTLGHAAGDELLVEVAERLRASVRASDAIARLAGDEFAVLLRDVTSEADAAGVAAKIVGAIGAPFALQQELVGIGVSVGVAIAPDHGQTPDELLRAADTAMYAAKVAGSTYRMGEPLVAG